MTLVDLGNDEHTRGQTASLESDGGLHKSMDAVLYNT